MLAISVELLHGTFRADPDGTAHTGHLRTGEWPPAPSRLFAALVAADGTRDRCRVTTGRELEWFEKLPAPVIHAHAEPWHQPLLPRYVAAADRTFATTPPAKKGLRRGTRAHLEYIGRQGVEVRPGVRVTPRHSSVVYAWDTPCPGEMVHALRQRAARIGYLGTADSPVRVRVHAKLPDSITPDDAFRPQDDGDMAVRVPRSGDVQRLDAAYDAWAERGVTAARGQFPALRHEAKYLSPTADSTVDRGTVVAWLRLEAAVSGRRVSTVNAVFKGAVLRKYQDFYGEPPATLHGHGFRKRGYDLARFLALPDAGFKRSRGRIHGLALWLPPGCEPGVKSRAGQAALAVRRLWGGGLDVAVMPHANRGGPVAARRSRWERSARCWITAFPAVHERRVPLDLAEVTRWCAHAGLPAPVAFRSARAPLVRGGVDLAPVEVNRPGRPGLPYSHVQLWFAEPVRGPVVIGSARQRGLGLCIDLQERDAAND
ncbi:type I-U CRISPR-associated protein Csb2 [Candidatus Palauibacter sp.]|uniref:type I-G CRISPR-associated protein Csb2 n=1 Tax=Candidatus Palauibacter sp. TaxID=3101350 RepID=UPI003B02EB8A